MNEEEKRICDETKSKKHAKQRNVLEPGYVAPDGGWGWMVVIASGFSTFCTASLLLSYGLMFRDRFAQLGINASQTTTIFNIHSAVTACVGLANGPMFRNYTYRQVSCVGALVCGLSICALSFMKTFYGILLFYSILYGTGNSLAMSSCALAINAYFKKKRRLAVGLSWTCTGLAPIIIPQLVTLLLPIYDVSGTVLLFGGMTFNAVACALLMQPVSEHANKESKTETMKIPAQTNCIVKNDNDTRCTLTNGSCRAKSTDNICYRRNRLVDSVADRWCREFGSQYLYYDAEEQGAVGLDVLGTGTPMMSRANDGWYSKPNSCASLSSNKTAKGHRSRQTKIQPISIVSRERIALVARNELPENLKNDHTRDGTHGISGDDGSAAENLLKKTTAIDCQLNEKHEETKQLCCNRALDAIVVFFDLNLLQDPVYVNLIMGITLVNFADFNFFALTPFVLSDYGLRKSDVADIMSVLATVDVITRLMIPIIATRIGWENRTFYMIAMAILAIGRILLAHMKTYNFLMATAVFIGAGKAFRTIFVALVIPSHVPLDRLPAATGLQLATAGITYLTFGPIVGWIKDTYGNFTITLHCLNLFTCVVIISWTVELCYRFGNEKKIDKDRGGHGNDGVP